jgi:hypothetical protein
MVRELAQAECDFLRPLIARVDVALPGDERGTATGPAIAAATAFPRDSNRNFADDYEAYGEVKRNLGRRVAVGQGRLAMPLALELVERGRPPVSRRDEGRMTADIGGA